jgi:hypothetical protein
MPSLAYRLRIRNQTDTVDELIISSVPSDAYAYIAENGISGDGATLDPITGKVTIGAYRVRVIDAEVILHPPELAGLDEDFEGYTPHPGTTVNEGETAPPDAGADADDIHHDWGVVGAVYNTNPPLTLELGTDATAPAGPHVLQLTKVGGSQYFGGLYAYRTVTGLTIGQQYTVTAYLKTNWPTSQTYIYAPVGLGIAGIAGIGGEATASLAAYGAWERLAFTFRASATSHDVRVGWLYGHAAGGTEILTVDAVQLLTGATADVPGRIVTGSLTDLAGRQQLLSRKAFVEESEDGSTWTNLVAGYVNDLALVDAITYAFTIGESKRIEQSVRVFDRITDPARFPAGIGGQGSGLVALDRTCCLVGGPIVEDFAHYQDRGRPTYEVLSVDGQVVRLQWKSGPFHSVFKEFGPPIRDSVRDFINAAAAGYVAADTIVGSAREYALCPNLRVRCYDPGTGAWVADQVAVVYRLAAGVLLQSGGEATDWALVNGAGNLSALWSGTPPAVGTRYKLAVFPEDISARNPIHVTGHPVDIYTALAASKGIAVDQASADVVKAALGNLVAELRIVEGATFEAWVTQHLFGPFGFTVRTNTAAVRELLTTRVRPAAVPTTILTADDLASDEGAGFRLTEPSAVIKVTLEVKSYRVSHERHDETPLDAMAEAKITLKIGPSDPVTVFGDREVRFAIPGALRGMSTGTDENPGILDLWAADQYGPLFDWLGRGQITGEFAVVRGRVDELVGDEIVQQVAYVPTANPAQSPTSQRGTTARRCQILRRTEGPEGPVLLLMDRGPAVISVSPVPFEAPECGELAVPTDLAATVMGTTVVLTWVVGDTDLPIEVLLKLTSETVYATAALLPAGSTTYTLTLPDGAADYTVGVRHRDLPPGICASDTVTVAVTTGAVATLNPPVNPVGFADGAGTYGLQVTATELAAAVEVWQAPETAVGSATPGPYTLMATVPSVASGPTVAQSGIWPNDGTRVYLRARHVQAGYDPSAYTSPVEVWPWLIATVPPDPDPDEPGNDALLAVPIDLALRTTPIGFTAVGADPVSVTEEWSAARKFPLANFVSARAALSVILSTLPVGAVVWVGWWNEATSAWESLDGEGGPLLAVDPDSLEADELTITAGDWVGIQGAARDDVRVAAFLQGGDGGAGVLIVGGVALQLLAQAAELPPPEVPDPPIEIPPSFDPCLGGITDDFESYADTDALLAVYSKTGPVGTLVYQLSPTDGEGGGQCAQMTGVWSFNSTSWYFSLDVPCTPHVLVPVTIRAQKLDDGSGLANFFRNDWKPKLLTDGVIVSQTTYDNAAHGTWQTLEMLIDPQERTTLQIRFGVAFGIGGSFVRTVNFDSLALCGEGGSTDGVGTGGGPDGTDEVPDPAPATTVRPFGAFSIPTTGAGIFNATVKSVRPSYITNGLLSQATTNGMSLFMLLAGAKSGWTNSDGTFSLTRWKQRLDELAGNTDLATFIASGLAAGHYLIDQPYVAGSYGGQVVGPATLDAMAAYSKTLWPDLPTYIRGAPSRYASASMLDLDGYWAQYSVRFGDCATWRDQQIAIATAQGKLLVTGLNVIDGGAEGAGYGGSGRWMSAAEVRRYGSIMAGHAYPSAFVMWQFQADHYAQVGMPSAWDWVAGVLADFDP